MEFAGNEVNHENVGPDKDEENRSTLVHQRSLLLHIG
jgi:hypothetical protein